MSATTMTKISDPTLSQKLERVKLLESSSSTSWLVNLNQCVSIDIPPQSKYASFPYHDYTPYCQPLSRKELLQELSLEDYEDTKDNKKKLINEPCNVSSSSEGVCIVTRSVMLSNSHAGTHADQPSHFEKDCPFPCFDDYQYTGPCIVLNLKKVLQNDNTIQVKHLQEILAPFLNHDSNELVTRILFRTRDAPVDQNQEWTNDFPHFDPKCAQWLVDSFPNLLLVGIDTPSIDHPSAAPIIHCSHGALWNQRVAILENLNLGILFTTSDNNNNNNDQMVLCGHVQTIWNPMQVFGDAKGCMVRFYHKRN